MQGKQFAQQQEQLAKQQELQAKREAVDQESAGMMKQAMQDHVLRGGKPEEFRPPEDLMFKMAESRSASFAKHGLMEDFYANEAKVAPMRLQARAKAVQQYEADRDPVKFVMAVNNSMFNGKDVKGVEKIDATPQAESADGLQGVEGTKGGVRVTFSDGTSQIIDPDAAAKGIKVSMLDPKQWAMSEAQAAAKRLEQEHRAETDIKVVRARGDEARKTIAAGGEVKREIAGIQADSREAVAATNADSREAAAETRATGAVDAAKARGPARGAGTGPRTSDEVARFKARELAARSAAEGIRKDLASKQSMLKDAGAKDRPAIQAAIDDLRVKLDSARKEHSDVLAEMKPGRAGGGLADAAPAASAPMEQARAKAVSSGEPVQYDLGGKKGTIAPSGGLEAVAPKPAASAPAKKAANDDKFVKGKVYKDAKGNRARYAGDGKWEPI